MKYRWKLALAVIRARTVATLRRGRLAPGVLNPDQTALRRDQRRLLTLHHRHGPIFKIWWQNQITTCIVGHKLAARFLTENKGKLLPVTADREALFPGGVLRGMEGEKHSTYRRKLLAAFKAVDLAPHEAALRTIFHGHLAQLAAGGPVDAATLAAAMKHAATAVFLRLILGLDATSPIGAAFTRGLDAFIPNGIVVFMGDSERAHYEALRALTLRHAAQRPEIPAAPMSLLASLAAAGEIDDTILGNLIMMVEGARYDSHGLWRWIVHELATSPEFLASLRTEPDRARRQELASSAVRETLRMQQSEYLHRAAAETLEFEGFTIPQGTWVRLCMWEGHRDPASFRDPDAFQPERFVGERFGTDRYAPLGLDHHMCLGAQWTFDIGALLVDEIAKNFALQAIHRGTPAKGRFHFEPGADSVLAITRRQEAVPA